MKVCHVKQSVMGAVLVDRSTPWGNPYVMEFPSQEERDRVCEEFEIYATKRNQEDPDWLKPLVGKDLKCWCYPRRCHAETLIRLANKE